MRTVFALVALLLSGHLASSVSRAVAANPVASRCSYPLLPTPRARPPHSPDPSTIVTQEPLVTALDRNESAVEATTLDNLIAGSWGQLFRASVSTNPITLYIGRPTRQRHAAHWRNTQPPPPVWCKREWDEAS